MEKKFGITLRLAIVTFLSGLLSLLVSFWVLNAIVFLQHQDENWGELGFTATTILESLFMSLGYTFSFLLIFLPWTYIKCRRHLSNMRLMEASVGGIVFGFMVLVLSVLALECIMGGSFSDFKTELTGTWSAKGICWPISAMISGVVTLALAAYCASAGSNQGSSRRPWAVSPSPQALSLMQQRKHLLFNSVNLFNSSSPRSLRIILDHWTLTRLLFRVFIIHP
jgi:hypothetical protein